MSLIINVRKLRRLFNVMALIMGVLCIIALHVMNMFFNQKAAIADFALIVEKDTLINGQKA